MTRWLAFFCVLFIRPSSLIVADHSCINSNPLRSDCEGIRLCGTVHFNDDNLINCPRRMIKGSSDRSLIADLQCDRISGKWKSIVITKNSNITGRIERGINVYCEYDECVSSKLFPPCGTDIECKEVWNCYLTDPGLTSLYQHQQTNVFLPSEIDTMVMNLVLNVNLEYSLRTRLSEAEDWVKLENAKHLTCHKEKFWANDQALPAGAQASCREPYVEDEGSNIGLYIALGVIGLIAIVTIFLCVFMRKTGTKWHHFGFHDKTPAAKKEYDFNTPPINSPIGNSPRVKSPDVGSPHVAATTPSNKNVSAEVETGTPRKAPSTEKGGVTTSADKITNEDLMSKEKINENQVFNI